MTKPIRVMHIMGHMAGGGVEATIMNHYRHIDRNRIQFDFVVDADSTVIPEEEITALGGRIFTVPPYKQMSKYLNSCERIFIENKPDIVHSNINALSVFPLLAAKRAGVEVRIAHSHSTSNPKEYAKTVVKNVLRPFSKLNPTHLVACSADSARWLFGGDALRKGRVHIVKNAIDLEHFRYHKNVRTHARASLEIGEGTLVIGQIGRFVFKRTNSLHSRFLLSSSKQTLIPSYFLLGMVNNARILKRRFKNLA